MGAPAGPKYLLKTLRGEVSRREALKEWQKEEADARAEKEDASTAANQKWPFSMKLPYRYCEQQKSLTAFTTSRNLDDVWAQCISRGADLVCVKCKHELGLEHMPTSLMYCEKCETKKRRRYFAPDMQKRWELRGHNIHCKRCTGEESA